MDWQNTWRTGPRMKVTSRSAMADGLLRRGKFVARSVCEEGLGFVTLWPRVQRSVPGWLVPEDARLLYALAHHGPAHGAIVEIGSAWGLSTIFLAAGTRAAGRERVVAVDPHTGDPWYLTEGGSTWPPASGLSRLVAFGAPWPPYLPTQPGSGFSSLEGFRANLRRFNLDTWVKAAVQPSTDAASTVETGPIRLLYIDGLHSYEGVRDDIQAWVPRVVSGGVIVFDDYFNDKPGVGVRPAVDELLRSGEVSPCLQQSRSLTWTLKN